jgi:Tol biopolymer transport system component
VIKEEPRWDGVPVKLQRLLKACLEKDPKRRLRDIGDAWRLLEETPAVSTAPSSPPSRSRFSTGGWVAAGVFALLAVAVSVVHFREQAPQPELVRFQVPPPAKNNFDIYLALSPDGRRLAFTTTGADGLIRIWVRDLETLEARPLNGTEGAQSLFWSPDNRAIAFGVGRQLKKVDVAGGPPLTLCDSPNTVGSGAWSKSGMIVFGGRGAGPLRQVSEAGGTPSAVTELDAGGYHSFPSFLPDGLHFIYYRTANGPEAGIYLGSLDAKPKEQSPKRLVASGFGGVYGPSSNGGLGRILFLREGTLMAQPFDAKRLELAGEAVPVAERVGSTNQYGNFSAAANGSLAYRTGSAGNTQLTWLDSQGKALNPVGEPGQYASLALSPDAARAAFRRAGAGDLWLMEFAHGVSTRFTFTQQGLNDYPVWSPDGKSVVFESNRSGRSDLYRKASNGAGEDELLLQTDQNKFPTSWSRDGRFLLYISNDPKTVDDLWVLPLEGDRKPISFLRTEFQEGYGAFSPDAHWVAYLSTESGSTEVYTRPFTAPGSRSPGAATGKWQVSKGGAQNTTPFWRADGKELYYRGPTGALMAVDVNASPTFQSGAPHRLFDVLAASPLDAAADGKRFLAGLPQQESGPQAITVVLNWQAGLKK